jgi:hypothetical protein
LLQAIFSAEITSLPLYVPQLGQTRWGIFGSPHCGQTDMEGCFKKSCALRVFRLVLECLFTGFGMINYPLFN